MVKILHNFTSTTGSLSKIPTPSYKQRKLRKNSPKPDALPVHRIPLLDVYSITINNSAIRYLAD